MVAAPEAAVAVGRDEGDPCGPGPRQLVGDEVGRGARQPAEATFLPAADEGPRRVVVEDRGARGGERDLPALAFAAAVDGPLGRRAAPPADRRLDADEPGAATLAELTARATAHEAPPREDEVEQHTVTLRAAGPGDCAETAPSFPQRPPLRTLADADSDRSGHVRCPHPSGWDHPPGWGRPPSGWDSRPQGGDRRRSPHDATPARASLP